MSSAKDTDFRARPLSRDLVLALIALPPEPLRLEEPSPFVEGPATVLDLLDRLWWCPWLREVVPMVPTEIPRFPKGFCDPKGEGAGVATTESRVKSPKSSVSMSVSESMKRFRAS